MLRILYICDCLPHPPTSGGRQRTNVLLRALRGYGETDFVHVARDGAVFHGLAEDCRERYGMVASVEPRARGTYFPWKLVRPVAVKSVDRVATAIGSRRVYYRADEGVKAVVDRLMAENKYDLVVGRYLVPTAMSGVLDYADRLPIVLDLDDVDHLVANEKGSGSMPLLRRVALTYQRRQISAAATPLLEKAAHLWATAGEDAEAIGAVRASVLPNIPFIENDDRREWAPSSEKSQDILLVATIGYAPNRESVERFIKSVWPRIVSACPGAWLRIVGEGMREGEKKRWGNVGGVEAVGFVREIASEYQRAAFCIVPVSRGGGTKIKAVECFAFNRTCVVTPHGHRGIGDVLKDRESLWRAENDNAFVEGCVYLLKHPGERNQMAAHGRRLVDEHYSFENFQRIVGETLRRVGFLKERQKWSFKPQSEVRPADAAPIPN